MKDKLYSVADMMRITGYNRSTITRWINSHSKKIAMMQKNRPLYDATVLHEFRSSHNRKHKTSSSTKDELLAEKDARIKDLQEQVKQLNAQIAEQNRQFDTLSKLADQAQKLDLLGRPRLADKVKKTDDETSNERAASTKETSTPSKDVNKPSHKQGSLSKLADFFEGIFNERKHK